LEPLNGRDPYRFCRSIRWQWSGKKTRRGFTSRERFISRTLHEKEQPEGTFERKPVHHQPFRTITRRWLPAPASWSRCAS